MFELGKKTNEKPCNTIDTLIGAKTEIKGDISFSGGLRIDGKIKGNVTARSDDTKSVLVVSEHAVITGNVAVPHIVVNGAIRGHVRATERIELQAKADITGDVSYKMLEMMLGAVVNGNLVREESGAAEKVATPKLKSVSAVGESD